MKLTIEQFEAVFPERAYSISHEHREDPHSGWRWRAQFHDDYSYTAGYGDTPYEALGHLAQRKLESAGEAVKRETEAQRSAEHLLSELRAKLAEAGEGREQ